MKICIYGAGAIGGHLGAVLAEAGAEVTLIARGPHLEAIRDRGLKLIDPKGERVLRLAATEDPATAGPQDYVILALKVTSLPAITEAIQPLLGPETAIVSAQNGLPWWYFHRHGGPYEGHRMMSLDPEGALWHHLPPERCLGCVLYAAAEITAPGVVTVSLAHRFPIGEPDGSRSQRVRVLAEVMAAAGLDAPVRERIRDDIWVKLLGNLTFNPISVLTLGTMSGLAQDPDTRAVMRAMMAETMRVGEALGVRFDMEIEERLQAAERIGPFKTSMLQDLEHGRPMEIDALVTAVAEIGDLLDIDTPLIDTVRALVIHRARLAGCHPPA